MKYTILAGYYDSAIEACGCAAPASERECRATVRRFTRHERLYAAPWNYDEIALYGSRRDASCIGSDPDPVAVLVPVGGHRDRARARSDGE